MKHKLSRILSRVLRTKFGMIYVQTKSDILVSFLLLAARQYAGYAVA